jgi:uncharacterized protein (TIGR02646 family)
MRKINKSTQPAYFTKAIKKISTPKQSSAWSCTEISSIRHRLRDHILINEQLSLCVYCEKKINSDRRNSNIDHYKKRSLFPQLTLAYTNLVVSCNSEGRCSRHKDSQQLIAYHKVINPVKENPEDYFDYLIAGDIHPKNDLNKTDKAKAEYTIDVFNLNHIGLIQERKKVVYSIKAYQGQFELEDILKCFPSYPTFVKCIWEKLSATSSS